MTAPQAPPPHNLLAGKNVVITAAAGTGIGYATALRCAQEGANVLVSDIHPRRLGECAEKIERETGKRPPSIVCKRDRRRHGPAAY